MKSEEEGQPRYPGGKILEMKLSRTASDLKKRELSRRKEKVCEFTIKLSAYTFAQTESQRDREAKTEMDIQVRQRDGQTGETEK